MGFGPKSIPRITCGSIDVPFAAADELEILSSEEPYWFFDGESMDLVINCGLNSTELGLHATIATSLDIDLNGLRGCISRCELSHENLDEANVTYGNDLKHLLDCSTANAALTYAGADHNTTKTLTGKLRSDFKAALEDVKK